jgi:RND superfamily putative drug exporter
LSSSRFSTAGIARVSARRPWITLGFWLVLLVLAAAASPMLGDSLTTESTFTNNPESQQGQDLLEARQRGEKPNVETVIVHSHATIVDAPAFKQQVDQIASELSAMPELVTSIATYYQTGDESLVSSDRHSTIIPVTLAGSLDDATERVPDFEAALQNASLDASFEIMTVGDASVNHELSSIAEEDLAMGEQFGLPIALIILVVVFGALVAAGLPVIIGLVSIFIAVGLAAIVGQTMDLSFFIVNMIGMIGLAVGIDYALFVIERYREERRRGHSKHEAIEIAGGTASKAVLFSGGTVILALSGMLLVPSSIFKSLGLGAVLVVIVAIAATLMLIPALLSILGDKIDWPRRKKYDESMAAKQAAHDGEVIHGGFWGRMAKLVMAHPVISLVLTVSLLIACALPYFDINEGSMGVSGLPADTESGAAFTSLQHDFPAGLVSPVEIVIDGDVSDPAVQGGIDRLNSLLAGTGVFGQATVTENETGDLALVSAPMTIVPDSDAAYDEIATLREEIVPAAFNGINVDVYVSGATALNADFTTLADDWTPIVFAFVLGLSFILLMIAFRSIVVPAKAIVMNLLSVGAAYGLIVLVFQKGYGADFFGFQQTPTIESWLPIFLFCVLFGLSMDYHVFLLSRIREHYDLTKRNSESVAVGLQSTARIITGAALIMVAVFSGFAAGRLVTLQQAGFGLAVAVLLDATIVRSILVPASMALLGDRNWYLPNWLGWLPKLHVEGKRIAAPGPMLPSSVSGDD